MKIARLAYLNMKIYSKQDAQNVKGNEWKNVYDVIIVDVYNK